jgi:hypothetical protein
VVWEGDGRGGERAARRWSGMSSGGLTDAPVGGGRRCRPQEKWNHRTRRTRKRARAICRSARAARPALIQREEGKARTMKSAEKERYCASRGAPIAVSANSYVVHCADDQFRLMEAMSSSMSPTLRPRAASASPRRTRLAGFTARSRMSRSLGLGAVAVLGGEHAQRTMHVIGHIPDGDRGHDARLPGMPGMIARWGSASTAATGAGG